MALEAYWFDLCGTGSVEETSHGDGRGYYWKLISGLLLIKAVFSLQSTLDDEPNFDGCFKHFTLYFSIVNGWWLYVHHYASRFMEDSRLNSMLLCLFLVAMAIGVFHATFDDAERFSMSMIAQRMAVLILVAKAGVQNPRAGSFCISFTFLLGDSILCYTLAGSDRTIAPYLWTFWVFLDLGIDLFLIVALPGPTLVPYDLKMSMERLEMLIIAPIASFLVVVVSTITNDISDRQMDKVSLTLSFVLILLFGAIYYQISEDATLSSLSYSPFCRALLLLVSKLLGWSLSLMGACLVALCTSATDLIWYFHCCAGMTLVLLLSMRLFASRPRSSMDLLWPMACWVPFFSVTTVGRNGLGAEDSNHKIIGLPQYISVYISVCTVLIAADVWSPYTIGPASSRIRIETNEDEEEPSEENALLSSRSSSRNYMTASSIEVAS